MLTSELRDSERHLGELLNLRLFLYKRRKITSDSLISQRNILKTTFGDTQYKRPGEGATSIREGLCAAAGLTLGKEMQAATAQSWPF